MRPFNLSFLSIILSILLFSISSYAQTVPEIEFSLKIFGDEAEIKCDFLEMKNGKAMCHKNDKLQTYSSSALDEVTVTHNGQTFNVTEINEVKFNKLSVAVNRINNEKIIYEKSLSQQDDPTLDELIDETERRLLSGGVITQPYEGNEGSKRRIISALQRKINETEVSFSNIDQKISLLTEDAEVFAIGHLQSLGYQVSNVQLVDIINMGNGYSVRIFLYKTKGFTGAYFLSPEANKYVHYNTPEHMNSYAMLAKQPLETKRILIRNEFNTSAGFDFPAYYADNRIEENNFKDIKKKNNQGDTLQKQTGEAKQLSCQQLHAASDPKGYIQYEWGTSLDKIKQDIPNLIIHKDIYIDKNVKGEADDAESRVFGFDGNRLNDVLVFYRKNSSFDKLYDDLIKSIGEPCNVFTITYDKFYGIEWKFPSTSIYLFVAFFPNSSYAMNIHYLSDNEMANRGGFIFKEEPLLKVGISQRSKFDLNISKISNKCKRLLGLPELASKEVKGSSFFAKQGDADNQYELAGKYYTGQGVIKNDKEAFKWCQKAAQQGHVEAQFELAGMFYRGEGVTKNYNETYKWYRKAALQGKAAAQARLGILYDSGIGVKQDYRQAFKWFSKAAYQGDADAQYSLGIMYENGDWVAKNKEEALKWYEKAAQQGHEESINILVENSIQTDTSNNENLRRSQGLADQANRSRRERRCREDLRQCLNKCDFKFIKANTHPNNSNYAHKLCTKACYLWESQCEGHF